MCGLRQGGAAWSRCVDGDHRHAQDARSAGEELPLATKGASLSGNHSFHIHIDLASVKEGLMAKELTGILTDAGTNEVEILVFLLDGGHYGVNVAKVREIIAPTQLTRLPESHAAIRGVFKLREHVLPQVDLRAYFNMAASEDESATRVIVTEFNGERLGFLVDHVERIHRISWGDLSEVPYEAGEGDLAINSVVSLDDKMVLMLDFERIAFRIAGIDCLEEASSQDGNVHREHVKVLLADDSRMMRKMLEDSLRRADFKDLVLATDGEEAWTKLNELLESASLPDIVVTDIEMPRMDGLHLTRRIKQNPRLKDIPVIVFSSLVSDDNLKKGKQVGADRQLTKPQLAHLVEAIDELLQARAAV